jgi:hypothetical protein
MKIFIALFVLTLLGSLGSQRHDEWYRIYETGSYMSTDSTSYVEMDLRLYPPEFRFYDDTTISTYPWKLCVWFRWEEENSLGGVKWVSEYTETYGEWIYTGFGRMFLRGDSLRKYDDIVWRRQENDGMSNSYFLVDHGNHYDLKIFNSETLEFIDVISFLK